MVCLPDWRTLLWAKTLSENCLKHFYLIDDCDICAFAVYINLRKEMFRMNEWMRVRLERYRCDTRMKIIKNNLLSLSLPYLISLTIIYHNIIISPTRDGHAIGGRLDLQLVFLDEHLRIHEMLEHGVHRWLHVNDARIDLVLAVQNRLKINKINRSKELSWKLHRRIKKWK